MNNNERSAALVLVGGLMLALSLAAMTVAVIL